MADWTVTYVVDAWTETPLEAAREVAEMLASDPAVPRRAVYKVQKHGSPIVHTIDLDNPKYGGENAFPEFHDDSYTLCVVEGCPFFIEANSAWDGPGGEIAEYTHLTRGDKADDEAEDHEAMPGGESHPLWWWKQHGPERVRERFIDPCLAAGEHQHSSDHRFQECPVYHQGES